MDDEATTPAPAKPHRWRLRWRWWLAGGLGTLVLLLAAAAGLLRWALYDARGTAWLLARVPGLEVVQPQGSLVGDFSAASLRWRFGNGGQVALTQPSWRGLSWGRAAGPAWLRIAIDRLHVADVSVVTPKPPAQPQPAQPPLRELRLPVELLVQQLAIDRVQAAALGAEPVTGVQAKLHLGADGGRWHRVEALSLARGALSAGGSLQAGAAAPMPLDVRLQLSQAAVAPSLPAWQAAVALSGPLAEARLLARLDVAARETREAGAGGRREARLEGRREGQREGRREEQREVSTPQTLNVDAALAPFADVPLRQAQVRASALDLAAFGAGLPRTALSGSVTVAPAEAGRLAAQIDLRNAAPGAYSEGRLPARQIAAVASITTGDRAAARLSSLLLALGDDARPAGRVTGTAQWSAADGWQADLALDDLRTALLDARAPALALRGTVQASGRAVAGGGTRLETRLDLNAARSDAAKLPPLALQAEAALASDPAGGLQLELKRFAAQSGPGSATAQGRAARASASAPWDIAATLAARDFDPAPWLPAAADSPLRRGANRVSAEGQVALQWPAAGTAAATGSVLAQLAALRGRGDLRIAPSTLAGVPLQGELQLAGSGGADGLATNLRLQTGPNRVALQGRLGSEPQRDRWQAEIAAPALQALAPLVRVLDPGGRRLPAVQGAVQGDALVEGRWPQVRTQGRLQATSVVWPGLRLRDARARWQLGTAANAPLLMTASVADLVLPAGQAVRQVPSLALEVSGTTDAHRLALQADAVGAPAPGAKPGTAARAGPRTSARLRAEGSLLRDAAGGPLAVAGWRGRIGQLELRRGGEGAAPLLQAQALDIAWQTAPTRVALQPGRMLVMGSALAWRQLSWQAASAGRPVQIDADVSLEPVAVAPLVARLQPALGLAGDLEIGGRAVLHTAPVLKADIVLERRRGDLQLLQAGTRRDLGLSELRAAVRADGSAWRAQARVAGRWVGEATADIGARTDAANPWPATTTPIDGSVQLRLPDLAVYGALLPVGWRLGGQLAADAKITGTAGAPQYSGRVRGSELAVGNFFEGVSVRDGQLAAVLEGTRGRVERFTARAGDGTLAVQGSAELGAAPVADFTVTAERFRALGRADRQVDVNGSARLRLDAAGIAVQGRFGVDNGLVDLGRSEAPTLAKDVRVVDGPTPGRPPQPPPDATPPRPLKLDLRIDLGSKLRLRGKGINTLLAGDLHLTSPGGKLAVDGSIRTEQGTYEAYGEKLAIERGLITFAGAVDNPRLDIRAVRSDLRDVEVGVAITGSAQSPQVKLFSNPDMSELDKLSWLALGRSSAGLASDQSAILQRAAMALLAGQGGSGDQGIVKRLGLDTLSVGRGASGGLSDAVVSLGKQVSQRLYVGYAQSLDASGGSWEVIYKIARRMTVRLQTGEVTALDVLWTWIWG